MKELIKLIGLGGMITYSILHINVFLTAYLNGIEGNDYKVIVYINHYGEAHLELIMLIILIPFIIYFVYSYIKSWYENVKKFKRIAV